MSKLPQNQTNASRTDDLGGYPELSGIAERLTAARRRADAHASTIADMILDGLAPSDELRTQYRDARDKAAALCNELDRHLKQR